jgi:hypothetical protein
MSLIKLNNRAVKDVTQFGSISSLGSLTHISTATASSSASIEFTLGDYKEYQFYFVNIHPQTNIVKFTVNFRDGESLFDATKTTTYFRARHDEAGTTGQLGYDTGEDLAQSTGEHTLCASTGNDNDQCLSGILKLFNPSSTTFVKHFIADMSDYRANDYNAREMTAGYCNTTSAIDGIRFQMSSGNIDDGQILLFGVN